MEIEPKALGIPLHKRNWSPLWHVLGSLVVAALYIKPDRASQWIAAVIVLAPALWVAFGGPWFIHRWQNNPVPILRGLVFILRIAFLLAVLWYGVPFFVGLLDGIIHA